MLFRSDLQLTAKWNLVPITADMTGGYLSDIKGDCEFEKIYKWEALSQEWKPLDEGYAFQETEENYGLIIKAKEACMLGGAVVTAIAPPAMPE